MISVAVVQRKRRILGAVLSALVWAFAASHSHAHAPGPNSDSAPGLASAKEFPISFGGPFTLVDHQGRERTDKDFKGQYLLVFFGYTFCPDICPTGLQTLSSALDLLGEGAARVQPLYISVDPERDRPETLKSYVGHFHPRLIGLTGSEKQVRDAARAYRVHRSKVILADAPKDEYLVNHTSITYLMGPDGKFVTLVPHGTKADVMAKALKRYLAGTGRS
jgi:protein SCO1/2